MKRRIIKHIRLKRQRLNWQGCPKYKIFQNHRECGTYRKHRRVNESGREVRNKSKESWKEKKKLRVFSQEEREKEISTFLM